MRARGPVLLVKVPVEVAQDLFDLDPVEGGSLPLDVPALRAPEAGLLEHQEPVQVLVDERGVRGSDGRFELLPALVELLTPEIDLLAAASSGALQVPAQELGLPVHPMCQ